jgi:hypothetical protein
MRVYSFSEARQNFASVLDQAKREGSVGIRRRDGSTFIIQPAPPMGSPLDVPGVNLGVTTDEIVSYVREARQFAYGQEPSEPPADEKE